MDDDIARVMKVRAAGERSLRVRFAGERRDHELDMTGLIARSLDVSATTLRRIAEEQQPMTGADFAKWRTALGLSLTEAAALLGVSRRTIMGYLQKDDLPPVVAIACRALARDKHILAAHFVPARKGTRRAA
jgi:DNA-binding transcriptional regulator YiaG